MRLCEKEQPKAAGRSEGSPPQRRRWTFAQRRRGRTPQREDLQWAKYSSIRNCGLRHRWGRAAGALPHPILRKPWRVRGEDAVSKTPGGDTRHVPAWIVRAEGTAKTPDRSSKNPPSASSPKRCERFRRKEIMDAFSSSRTTSRVPVSLHPGSGARRSPGGCVPVHPAGEACCLPDAGPDAGAPAGCSSPVRSRSRWTAIWVAQKASARACAT